MAELTDLGSMKRHCYYKRYIFTTFLAVALWLCPGLSYADCINPAAIEGHMIYNADYRVPQVCIEDQWIALGPVNDAVSGSGCSAPAGTEGQIIYNSASNIPQYCDGDDWRQLAGSGHGCLGPSDCPYIGDVCGDSTVFAGCHPTTHWELFVYPNTQVVDTEWSTLSVNTGADSKFDGRLNQEWVVNNTILTQYEAFKLCDDLNQASALGHNDWYLPSMIELHYLRINQNQINQGLTDNFTGDMHWSSTEVGYDTTLAWKIHFSNMNGVYAQAKTGGVANNEPVRCIRRNEQ